MGHPFTPNKANIRDRARRKMRRDQYDPYNEKTVDPALDSLVTVIRKFVRHACVASKPVRTESATRVRYKQAVVEPLGDAAISKLFTGVSIDKMIFRGIPGTATRASKEYRIHLWHSDGEDMLAYEDEYRLIQQGDGVRSLRICREMDEVGDELLKVIPTPRVPEQARPIEWREANAYEITQLTNEITWLGMLLASEATRDKVV